MREIYSPLKPYCGNNPYLFVSYSHENEERVYEAISWLQSIGYRIWFDHAIPAGGSIDKNVRQHIENCTAMLSFLSKSYMKSKWCLPELKLAWDMKILVIPIDLESDYDWPEDFSFRISQEMKDIRALSLLQGIEQGEFLQEFVRIDAIRCTCEAGVAKRVFLTDDRSDAKLAIGGGLTGTQKKPSDSLVSMPEQAPGGKPKEPQNACKVVFLGDCGAGKSTLLNRIIAHPVFRDVKRKLSEKGMCTVSGVTQVNDIPCRIRFLDPDEDAIRQSAYRLFMSKNERAVYILVCSCQNDSQLQSQAEKWLKIVRNYAPESHIIIVFSKCSKDTSDVNRKNLNESGVSNRPYPELHFIKTYVRCKDDADKKSKERGIDELVSSIQVAAAECGCGTPCGDSTRLRTMGVLEKLCETKDYITLDDFECIEDQYTGKMEKKRETLEWLMERGVISYCDEEANLCALRASWVTDVLSTAFAANTGRFLIPEAELKRYARSILRTMAQEGIVYLYPEHETTYLVPALLSNAPQTHDRWLAQDAAYRLLWEADTQSVETVRLVGVLHVLMGNPGDGIRLIVDDPSLIWRMGACFSIKHPKGELHARAGVRIEGYSTVLEICVQKARDGGRYLDQIRRKVESILETEHLSAEAKIPYTVGGGEIRLSYNHVMALYDYGERIMSYSPITSSKKGTRTPPSVRIPMDSLLTAIGHQQRPFFILKLPDLIIKLFDFIINLPGRILRIGKWRR